MAPATRPKFTTRASGARALIAQNARPASCPPTALRTDSPGLPPTAAKIAPSIANSTTPAIIPPMAPMDPPPSIPALAPATAPRAAHSADIRRIRTPSVGCEAGIWGRVWNVDGLMAVLSLGIACDTRSLGHDSKGRLAERSGGGLPSGPPTRDDRPSPTVRQAPAGMRSYDPVRVIASWRLPPIGPKRGGTEWRRWTRHR